MNNKGTRATNGEGSIYNTIQKIKRSKKLEKECNICSNCTDRSICNNRSGSLKCKKCEECTECLKYCDRFYIYNRVQAQITINGKQTTVANENKRKDAVEKKKNTEAKVQTNNYIYKSNVTLLDLCLKVENTRFQANLKGENTMARDKYTYNKIRNSQLNSVPFQQLTPDMINNFLNDNRSSTSGSLDKLVQKIKLGCNQAVFDGVIAYADNPMLRVIVPLAEQPEKKVVAFELDEQIKIIKYIFTNPIIKNYKCNYDEATIRNIILLGFMTFARLGELGALNYETDINFNKKYIAISKTIAKDSKGYCFVQNMTKTGRKKLAQDVIDEKHIDFEIFNEKIITALLKNQIEIAKSNPNNINHLLFCQQDGSLIRETSITNIFKRICREVGVKLNIAEGCHMHMTRHSGITRMIEMGYDLFFIILYSGHSSIKEIERTYGHILADYRKKKIKNPDFKYSKSDIFPQSLEKLILSFYKK